MITTSTNALIITIPTAATTPSTRPLSSLDDLLPVSPKAGNDKSKVKGESKKGRFQPY